MEGGPQAVFCYSSKMVRATDYWNFVTFIVSLLHIIYLRQSFLFCNK